MNAALVTFKLIAFINGTIGLVGAIVLTVLLVGLLHLNPLVTLAGSFIGIVILFLGIIPVKALWKSKLLLAYQEESLYDYSLLSEVQMSFDKAKAQASCEKALAIFKKHYAPDDADIRKMELILGS